MIVEPLGPFSSSTSHARITQMVPEALGPLLSSIHARVTQMIAEVLGPPPNSQPCKLPAAIAFSGDVTGYFYTMTELGSETVPIALADSSVTMGYINDVTPTQFLSAEENWFEWFPLLGPLKISFSSKNPVRTLWVVTNAARATPPAIYVWASAFKFDLWKQACNP